MNLSHSHNKFSYSWPLMLHINVIYLSREQCFETDWSSWLPIYLNLVNAADSWHRLCWHFKFQQNHILFSTSLIRYNVVQVNQSHRSCCRIFIRATQWHSYQLKSSDTSRDVGIIARNHVTQMWPLKQINKDIVVCGQYFDSADQWAYVYEYVVGYWYNGT